MGRDDLIAARDVGLAILIAVVLFTLGYVAGRSHCL